MGIPRPKSVQNDSLFWQDFYHHPERDLQLIGVTGTDGKTSTATIVQQILGQDVYGYIGTNGVRFGNSSQNLANTTPVPKTLYRILADFRDQAARGAVLELSSEGKAAGRLNDLKFDCIGLTNLTSEHLNTHKTLANYIAVKFAILLDHLRPGGIAVLNADDAHFPALAAQIKRQRPDLDIQTYGYSSGSDSSSPGSSGPGSTDLAKTLRITDFEPRSNGTQFSFVFNSVNHSLVSPLLGTFNLENLSCALLLANSQAPILNNTDHARQQLQARIDHLVIPGRLQIFRQPHRPTVIVDYAHTPNGIERLFASLAQIGHFQKIFSVSGQAGSRDSTKRPEVGRLLAKYSTEFIITCEDPHWEDYQNVVNDLISKIEPQGQTFNYRVILDRFQAIKYAFDRASADDLILVLGKGAETSHDFRGVSIPFSDVETVQTLLGIPT